MKCIEHRLHLLIIVHTALLLFIFVPVMTSVNGLAFYVPFVIGITSLFHFTSSHEPLILSPLLVFTDGNLCYSLYC